MIKVYIMNDERFVYLDLMGKNPKKMLEDAFKPNFEVIESLEEIEEDAEYIAVLYQDTPLVDYAFLMELTQKGEGFAIGDGYIKKAGYGGKLESVDDIRAKQIKTLADAPVIIKEIRRRVLDSYRNRNILFYDLNSCYIDQTVRIEDGCIIHPMVNLKGNTHIGRNCVLFSFCDLIDTIVDEGVDIRSTYSLGAKIGAHTTVGPFACLRKGTVIGAYCRVGDFVEIKNSTIGDNTKMAHLAYVGDSTVGYNTNIGCGAVFANYNGRIKQRCMVGSNVFIGANSNLVAPVTVNDGAYIAAGSTVTHDVPGGNLCIARSRQVLKPNWERK